MLVPGDRIAEWVIEGPIGEGGMGTVYRVHSALAPRLRAALKVMKPTAEPDARARFVREAEALASVRHPAVVGVMGFGEDPGPGLLYLAMELAEGETLAARLERGPLGLGEAVRVFGLLASALEHAHRARVFHRDVKPANIVLCPDGSVRLVDFGIALVRLGSDTITTTHRGTLAYLPPEVFRGETPEPAAMDLYGLGLVLHEALTGVRSFRIEGVVPPAAVAAMIGARKQETPPLDPGDRFPGAVRDIVRRATSGDPAARPTAAEFARAMDSAARREGATDTLPSPDLSRSAAPEATVSVPDPRRRRRGLVPLVLGGLAVLAIALALAARGAGSRGGGEEPAVTPPPEPAADAPRATPRAAESRAASPASLETPAPIAAGLAADGGVSGRWDVLNHIDESSYPPFRGLRLGYEIVLRETGRRVSGEGRKVSENGRELPAPRRTPILITGQREGRILRVSFMERGAERNSAGTMEWRLSDDGRSLEGTFGSDSAGSRGSSVARRAE